MFIFIYDSIKTQNKVMSGIPLAVALALLTESGAKVV